VAAADREDAMNPLERLKALTKPMSPQEVNAFLVRHYGALSRETACDGDDALPPEDLVQIENRPERPGRGVK